MLSEARHNTRKTPYDRYNGDSTIVRKTRDRRGWITGESNPADAMTKHASNTSLARIIETNKVNIQAAAWVERDKETGYVG